MKIVYSNLVLNKVIKFFIRNKESPERVLISAITNEAQSQVFA